MHSYCYQGVERNEKGEKIQRQSTSRTTREAKMAGLIKIHVTITSSPVAKLTRSGKFVRGFCLSFLRLLKTWIPPINLYQLGTLARFHHGEACIHFNRSCGRVVFAARKENISLVWADSSNAAPIPQPSLLGDLSEISQLRNARLQLELLVVSSHCVATGSGKTGLGG